eukprot:gene10179-13695_t
MPSKYLTLWRINERVVMMNMCKKRYLSNEKFKIFGVFPDQSIQIESKFYVKHSFSQQEVDNFANLCGDNNPIHIDEKFAATTPFQGTIVHGILVSSLFSTLLGRSIPGAIYVSQNLSFKRPVKVGESITAQLEVTALEPHKRGTMMTCNTVCLKDNGSIAVEGVAKCLIPT